MTTRTNRHAHSSKDKVDQFARSNAIDDSAVGASSLRIGEVDDAEQLRRIEEAAYYRAERRGFCPGCEMEDWLAAEREVGEQRNVDPSAGGAVT